MKRYKETTDSDERVMLGEAMDQLDLSIDNPDQREDAVRDYVGMDPWSWLVIPQFAELEELGIDNIYVEYADRMVVEAPLCY